QQVELEVVNERGIDLAKYAVGVGILARVARRRALERIDGRIEAKSARALDALGLQRVRRRAEDRVPGLQAHLVVQRADDELADGGDPAVMEERADAQVRIDSARARRVHVPVGEG